MNDIDTELLNHLDLMLNFSIIEEDSTVEVLKDIPDELIEETVENSEKDPIAPIKGDIK
ncbi:MAG TPA: hypothetical protein PLJ21_12680 [Pseudobdellovibrionaceae bacterium]|nr:hypothetical protein [Pseudobdellovibrionaceae bacterium]